MSCGWVSPRTTLVVAANELDQEALDPRDHQVEPEQDPGRDAVAQAPQHQPGDPHRQRLVDGCGMNLVGCRHRAVGVCHRPRQVRLGAVVAIARELAAHAADGVSDRERHRRGVEQLPAEPTPPACPEDHAEGSTHETAEPDQPGPREDVAEQVVGDLVPVLDQEVHARADEASDQGGEHHLVRPVSRAPELTEAAVDDEARGQEAEREADAERLQLERTDVNLGLHGRES